MSILAIIPARGGSKGIPHKNVHPLAGKPLIAHSIEHAQHARTIDRIIVSTDDNEISTISKQYGAEVVLRPAKISGDGASSESALLHTLEFLKQREGYKPDLVVFLQCTSPLTLPEDIDGTVRLLLNTKADTAFTVTAFRHFIWQENESGNAVGINHNKSFRLPRQNLDPQFLETGAVYVLKTTGFLKASHRFFGKTVMYIMPHERCLDIDEPIDFHIAEVLMNNKF